MKTNPQPAKRANVSQRKRALSNRAQQGSTDLNYKKRSVPKFSYPVKRYNSSTKQDEIVTITKDLFPYDSNQFSEIAVGFRKRDTSNPYFIFTPDVKDYRPFIWRRPKAYSRAQVITTGHAPEIVETFSFGSLVTTPSDYSITGDYIYQPGFNLVEYESSYAERQIHYLNFNKKLADQKVDVLTSVAEGLSTIDMLGNAAYDLFQFYRAVRKADTKSIRRILSRRGIKRTVSKGWRNKTAESRWLELQYGWSPLIGDLQTILKEFSSERQVASPIIKVVQSSLLEPSRHYDQDRFEDADFFGILKTSCYYTVNPSGIREAAKWNLGMNPLLTAWELVPYSFVLDWFIPIGDFLGQFSAKTGLQFISGTTVSYVRFSGTESVIKKQLLHGNYVAIKYSATHKGHRTERLAHVTSPIGFPVFDGGFNVKRALNALALLLILR